MQEALYCFIRIIWGLTESGSVPSAPDPALLREFNSAFSNAAEIRQVVDSPVARELIPRASVQTLQGMRHGVRKIGGGKINVSEFFIKYTQCSLAKLGLPIWGPGLDDAIDSLFNSACRIAALRIFCQLAIGGAFAYMNINRAYVEDFNLLEGAYNHYVHYRMAEKYRKEMKEEGKNAMDDTKKVIQRARLCVSD